MKQAEVGCIGTQQINSPLVSVIMPAHNAASTIKESIESVLSQTLPTWELLIVDDASTDSTDDIIQAYANQDSRIIVTTNDTNQGVAATRNVGIQQAKGEYLAFLDSDDLWLKEKLDKQVRFMKEKNSTISFTGTSYINSFGKASSYILQAVENFSYEDLLKHNIMSCSSVMVRRDSMIHFPKGYMHEDMAVWATIMKKAGVAHGLNEPLLIYRMGTATKSSNRIKSARMNYESYRHVGYGPIISFLYMLRYAKHSISKRYMIRLGQNERTGIANRKIKSEGAMSNKELVPTLKSYVYTRLLPLVKSKGEVLSVYPKGNTQSPILSVCDPMTWQNLSNEHAAVAITPRNWKQAFDDNQKYKFFFCEAAWTGAVGASWRAQVYKDGRVFYENRRDLLKILERCKADKISTVFWAKEDPAYFGDSAYDFADTALKFDFILTTANECVDKYKKLGHKQVNLWPFGFSPAMYHPPRNEQTDRENLAVFAGSWYTVLSERCNDLADIFDTVLKAGIPLRIYDRYRADGRSSKPFPEKYQPYVADSIPYDRLGDVYRDVQYVINVNTVCDSETMFARRVYEAMACGAIVISNPSIGMRTQFGNNVWYAGEDFDFNSMEAIRKNNIETVFAAHTWEQRMKQLFKIIGVDQ